jgi:TolB-like protein/predicted Zn-dependent protease
MPLSVGDRLGRYEILAPLGAGGMGEVYRARDPGLEREVALKVLPAATSADENARARLLREARMAAKLNHPHVCTVHEVGEADGRIYIAVLAGGPLPVEQAVRCGTQIADALAHAHKCGVVHRDLKSANVVITPEGRAKVLDFGLAKQMVGEDLAEATTEYGATLTVPGSVVGTVAYMAPEQLRGQAADARSDVWALGVVLFEMLGGRRPFVAETGYALSAAILNEPPPPLPDGVPNAVRAVVERCLAKHAGERFQTADEARSAMETAASGGVVSFPTPRSAPARRRWWLGGAALAAVVAVLAVLDVGGIRQLVLGRGGQPQAVRMAVLPFVNLTGDPEQEYLSDGVTQEMITQLGRLHPEGLSVIARSSVMRYKEGDTPVDQIGRELNVAYVLEGSARREGDRVRITAELIDTGNQTQLWADSYEREMSGILAVQSEVAQEVAEALALNLMPAEQARLANARTVDPEAYEAYLKGSQYWIKMTPGDLDTAEAYFNVALQKDPEFAAAYAGMTWVWACRNQMGYVEPGEAVPKMKAAALQAISLDDTLADSHYALAALKTWHEWDLPGAGQEWERAVELNPAYADGLAMYSHYLAIMGRTDEAMAEIDRALSIDPFNVTIHSFRAVDLLLARRFDDAIAQARKALSMDPRNPVASSALVVALVAQGMTSEALPLIKDRFKDYGIPGFEAALDRGFAEAGFAGAMKRGAEALAATDIVGLRGEVADFYVLAGDLDRAMEWLERAYEARNPNLPYIGAGPWYEPLRSDPRFQDLLRRMNLPED